MQGKTSIFRKQALEHQHKQLERQGDVLHLAPAWTRMGYRLLLCMLAAGLVFCIVGSVNEYASGPAVVRIEGKTTLAVDTPSIVATVDVQPGQRVEEGQALVAFTTREEASVLARLEREFDLQLVRFLREPNDTAAREALTTLRAERDLARARLEQRTLRAPHPGVIGDVRIQPGQFLAAGAPVLTLMGQQSRASLVAVLPGYYRPFLSPGMPLRIELDGFRYDYRELIIESVGEQIVGPEEVRRYLGGTVGDAIKLEGPLVLVKASLPSSVFQSQGQSLSYFEGMSARAEARVRSEGLWETLVPGLKGLRAHDP